MSDSYPTRECPLCKGKWAYRSERAFHPTLDDGIRVAWVCENDHYAYGGESWLDNEKSPSGRGAGLPEDTALRP